VAVAVFLALEHDRVKLTRSCSANELFERVIHVSGDSASDDHALARVGELDGCELLRRGFAGRR
jgi:hypothetical protein